ncbi:hypothetical protein PYCC9005_001571 [Savitreella phatthalungensis]
MLRRFPAFGRITKRKAITGSHVPPQQQSAIAEMAEQEILRSSTVAQLHCTTGTWTTSTCTTGTCVGNLHSCPSLVLLAVTPGEVRSQAGSDSEEAEHCGRPT